jgi:hypothetical protein
MKLDFAHRVLGARDTPPTYGHLVSDLLRESLGRRLIGGHGSLPPRLDRREHDRSLSHQRLGEPVPMIPRQ